MGKNILVIVSGPSGSGKTSIAAAISRHLRVPLIAKDDLKESLFDSLGWSDREWSRRLGGASIDLLFRLTERQLEAGSPALIEGNFKGEQSRARIEMLVEKHGAAVVQVICTADESILDARIRERWASGQRHPGHVDDVTVTEKLAGWSAQESNAIETEGVVMRIDTSDFSKINLVAICKEVSAMTEPALLALPSRA